MEYLYGINPALEVLNASSRTIFKAHIFESRNNNKLSQIEQRLKKNNIEVVYADKGKLINICGSKNHQGIVLEVSDYKYRFFNEELFEDRMILLDNIEDPQNLGAILRSAEIFGYKSVLLSHKGTPEIYPSVVKASAGATEYLKICNALNANSFVKKLKESGYKIIVLDEQGKNFVSDINTQDIEKFLLVIGGEDKSVGQFIINIADFVVRLKQSGKINSLNASVAAGIGMYALCAKT